MILGKYLFDLDWDPNEETNLYTEYPEVVKELQNLIQLETKKVFFH
jgi:hypothetical protein